MPNCGALYRCSSASLRTGELVSDTRYNWKSSDHIESSSSALVGVSATLALSGQGFGKTRSSSCTQVLKSVAKNYMFHSEIDNGLR